MTRLVHQRWFRARASRFTGHEFPRSQSPVFSELRAIKPPHSCFFAKGLTRISHEDVSKENGNYESCRWAQALGGAGVSPAVSESGHIVQKHRRDAGATKSRGKVSCRPIAAIFRTLCETCGLRS